jgi:hypothetical protein
MIRDPRSLSPERQAQIESIRTAARDAVREALRRHMLLGESVAIADNTDNGDVRVIGPDELRELLDAGSQQDANS